MNKRYFIYFSYSGSAYCGWQIQPNGVSVQEVMQGAFSTILRKEVALTAAGRTDAGVHAKCMIAHFDAELELFSSLSDYAAKLNALLPNDIAVEKIVEVKPDAHARFDATARRYEYHVIMDKNVFLNDYAMRSFQPLNFSAMNEAARSLYDYTDFTSFSKLHTDVKTNNCKVVHAEWTQRGDEWVFTIEADRFLRNMVRAIVGTLLEVGRGKIGIEEFRAIIESKNRSNAGMSVPAKGLYLVHVAYPDELFLH